MLPFWALVKFEKYFEDGLATPTFDQGFSNQVHSLGSLRRYPGGSGPDAHSCNPLTNAPFIGVLSFIGSPAFMS